MPERCRRSIWKLHRLAAKITPMGGISGVGVDSIAHRPRARWLRGRMSSPLSVRTCMVGLILVVIVPLMAFSAFLVLRSAEHEQEIMANTVRERTQAVAATIDHELSLLRSHAVRHRSIEISADRRLRGVSCAGERGREGRWPECRAVRSRRPADRQYASAVRRQAAGDHGARCHKACRRDRPTGHIRSHHRRRQRTAGDRDQRSRASRRPPGLCAQLQHRAAFAEDPCAAGPAAELDRCNLRP